MHAMACVHRAPSLPPLVAELVLQFLLDGLRISPVANYAARAVQSVCEKCRGRMVTHFQGLVQVAGQP